jgi:hypothetical protein
MGDGTGRRRRKAPRTFEAAFADATKRALQYSWGCPRGWGVVFGRRGYSARERRVPLGQTEAALRRDAGAAFRLLGEEIQGAKGRTVADRAEVAAESDGKQSHGDV